MQNFRGQHGKAYLFDNVVNVEDALHNLLVKRNPAYLGPVDAFADALIQARTFFQ